MIFPLPEIAIVGPENIDAEIALAKAERAEPRATSPVRADGERCQRRMARLTRRPSCRRKRR